MGFLILVSLLTCSGLLLSYILGILYSALWRPLKLQKYLKQQGIAGSPYKILSGNLKDFADANKEAQARPMGLSHYIVPRVAPFQDEVFKTYGTMNLTLVSTDQC